MSWSYTDITTNSQLHALMTRFKEKDVRVLAMDFEGEFNLHVYGERLCLIQVYDGHEFYLVDPQTIDARTVVEFLTIKNMLYMFYAADSDRSLVSKVYGARMLTVYDVQHLVEILDLPKKGLDAVIQSELGITVTGKKRYQRHNWLRRPIEEGAKQYALGDVAHLFALNDVLLSKIIAQNRVKDLAFRLAGATKDFDKQTVPAVFRSPGFKKLSKERQARFRSIYDLREQCARDLDIPAHLVIPKQELVSLAKDPARITSLGFSSRVNPQVRDRLVQSIRALSD